MRILGIKYYYRNCQHILNIYKYVKQKMIIVIISLIVSI